MKKNKVRILIIGPGASKTSSGGIVSVIENIMQHSSYTITMQHIVTMRPSSALKRVGQYFHALYIILINIINTDSKIAHIHMSAYTSFYRKSTIIMLFKLFRIPIIIHIHSGEIDIFFRELSTPMKKYVKWIFSLSDKTILLTKSWDNWYKKTIGINNSIVVYNGVKDYYDSSSSSLINRENTILFLGRLTEEKGIYDLLNAFKEVLTSIPDAQLSICGDGEMDKCRKTSLDLGIDTQVHFLGWVDEEEKYKLLNESKIYILPSYFEALPMGLLEGMSAGLATISTDVGGVPEVIQDDKNGLLIEVGNIEEITKSIVTLLKNPNKIEQLGKEARVSYLDKFDILKTTKNIENLYDNLLKEKS